MGLLSKESENFNLRECLTRIEDALRSRLDWTVDGKQHFETGGREEKHYVRAISDIVDALNTLKKQEADESEEG